MRTIAGFVTLAFATLGAQMISTSAVAQVTAPPSGTYSGFVTFQTGLTFTCQIGLNVSAANNRVTLSFNSPLSASPCFLLGFMDSSYSYTFDPIFSDITAHGVYISSPFPNDCFGSVVIGWDDTFQEFHIDATLQPVAGGSHTCHIEGYAARDEP